MTVSIAKLYEYFGVIGLLSAATWIAAGVVLIGAAHRTQRTRRLWRALGIALIALLLARCNSNRISEIRYDQSEEIAAGRELGRSLAVEVPGTNVVEDLADPALVLTNAAAAPGQFAYRAGGKVERDSGKTVTEEVAGIQVHVEEGPLYRTMRADDLHRANHYDRVNLLCVRLVVWLAFILVVLDYLRRLNTTFDAYAPLPIAAPWLDAAFPKTRTVCLQGDARERIREYLETSVRKGETFIYFGENDPWDRNALPRIIIRGRKAWFLEKVHCFCEREPFTATYVFESAWFNRYCFVVEGADLATRWLDAFQRFLTRRQAVRASSRRTVHIVWDLYEPIPPGHLEEVTRLCRETNHKLIVACRDEATPPGPFDEVIKHK